MMNRHYFDYHTGKLPDQEAFCRHLVDLGRLGEIEDEHVNPMTIRLLVTNDNLNAIHSFCDNVKAKLNFAVASVNQLGLPGAQPMLSRVGTSVSGAMSVTPAFTVPAPAPGTAHPASYTVSGLGVQYYHLVNNNTDWYHAPNISVDSFSLHKALYQFFTNFMSSLDRIALEITKLIPGTNADYFSELTNAGSDSVAHLNANGFNSLTGITVRVTGAPANLSEQVMQANKYRNRITHDGIIKIEIDPATGVAYLPDDPKAANPNFNIPLVSFCQEKFDKLLDLLNAIYAQLIVDIH